MNEEAKKIVKRNLIIIVLMLLLIRVVKGPFYIQKDYQQLDYLLKLNNITINQYTVDEIYKQPIVPVFVYFKAKAEKKYNSQTNTYLTKDDKYKLQLELLSCPNNNCNKENKPTIKNSSAKYKLKIKYKDNDLYNDTFTSDISKYITNTGEYKLELTGAYQNINFTINFVINVFE